jgi:hypothetical protein
MWIHVRTKSLDIKWLAGALETGMAIILSDRSYSKKKEPHVCCTGWAIACSRARRVVKGSFYKFFWDPSSHQGELAGLVAAHTLVLHTAQHLHLAADKGTIICDSQSALYKSSACQRRVCPGTKQANVFQTLQHIHQLIPNLTINYEWAKSHQDRSTPWRCLTLAAQLNSTCNGLANEAIMRALCSTAHPSGLYMLPFENIAIMINNKKITSILASKIRFEIGRGSTEALH